MPTASTGQSATTVTVTLAAGATSSEQALTCADATAGPPAPGASVPGRTSGPQVEPVGPAPLASRIHLHGIDRHRLGRPS